ncbi:hypothetical protein Tco_1260220 [Tanacetum coccineum]
MELSINMNKFLEEVLHFSIPASSGTPGATNLKDNNTLENIVKKQVSEGRFGEAVLGNDGGGVAWWYLLDTLICEKVSSWIPAIDLLTKVDVHTPGCCLQEHANVGFVMMI